ncbi:GntR family transcriptional regulator [Pseudogemmobacter sonorensis]|uniref:GntR family transcriptional regulator n=1 Tax=Pseudogemmobacter sonorensis TaxID=2989681 RepID=UPI0036782CD7
MNTGNSYNLAARIADNLVALLEEAIIFLDLAPNERLTEEEVALRYGVSRSPVRDALRSLERDGLVLREARKGIWVTPMSLRDFDEIYRCRIALEAIAAEQAAQSSNTAMKQKLLTVLDEMKRARDAGDARNFFSHDVQGSELIYQTADNQTLSRLLKGLEKQALRYRYHLYRRHPGVVDLSLDDTARIFGAIIDGDAELAFRLEHDLITKIWHEGRDAIREEFGEGRE